MTPASWTLRCSACDTAAERDRASLCGACGQPLFAQYAPVPKGTPLADRWDAWRYAPFMPLEAGEAPVSLGEGLTPMIEAPTLAAATGVRRLWVKDESQNPTVSFKARGMSAAVTRAKAQGYPGLVVPTAGNAGAALAAYGAAAGLPVRVFAPRTTPRPILDTIEALGATLIRIEGHIGDAGKLAIAYAAESGYFNVSTLREPYRVEGMKTMGFEMAEQLGWRLPDALVYPTGGGEGTIGIWKAINELMAGGWLPDGATQPRYVVAQAAGCAPIARAFAANEDRATPWVDPVTYASGLRVPSPLGDRLLLRVLRETHGLAGTATEEAIRDWTLRMATATGIDAAPEGGCALSVLRDAVTAGTLSADAEVVVFNTGSGASYRA
ncbi:threonine synthase [Gemmatimonas sp.]|jgi:threonine synthase|uniref:threonine synthase n=1 Tax=Gemmatimonas sp. TaxID=1962908 RepID=UPI0037BE3E5A